MKKIALPLISKRLLLRDFRMEDQDVIYKIVKSPGFRFVLLNGADPGTGKKFMTTCRHDAVEAESIIPNKYQDDMSTRLLFRPGFKTP